MTAEPIPVSADADLADLARLHAACFAKGWTETELRDLLETPGMLAFSVSNGFVLARLASDEAEILTLAVAPAARRQGLGSALLMAAAERARVLGGRILFLEVGDANLAARALYARLGFRAVGARKAYYAPHEDAHILRAELPLVPLGNSKASTKVAP